MIARLELASVRDSAIGELDVDVVDWVDGDDAHALALEGLPTPSAVAVSESMPALHLVPIADRLGATPTLATPVLRQLRMIKDDNEIAALRRAGAAIDLSLIHI